MISVEEALEKILSYVKILEPEEKSLLESLSQVLAEDIYSTINVPPLDNAAMDGYALKAEDTRGASESSPRKLQVIGEVAAGYMPEREITRGTAIRIMTGAPLPKGADTVVQFEHTNEELQKASSRAKGALAEIGILREARPGLNIRRAGEDIAKGALILQKGTVLRPSEIGVLASLGRPVVRVIRRPVVAVLATGDELVDIHQTLPAGKIYNSNTFSIAAQVQRYGGIPKILGIAGDTMEVLAAKIREGLDADMLITSGGVSMGDYDVVKDVLAEEGEIAFWTVRMKPGKPLAFGTLTRKVPGQPEKKVPHLGFPGNPVSSMITFELFARPAILKMLGKVDLAKPAVEAIIENPITNTDGRRIYARAVVSKRDGRYFASITGPQGSGILTSMAQANGLVVVPEDVESVKKGDTVQVLMLDWGEEVR